MTTELTKAAQQALEALESASNGLTWYQQEHPEDGSPADEEMHEALNQAMRDLRTALAQRPAAQTTRIWINHDLRDVSLREQDEPGWVAFDVETGALPPQPAAQTEREAFDAWFDNPCRHPARNMRESMWQAWQARASLPAPQQATPERHLTVTTNRRGEAVMVSWQDDEHRILEVVWEREQATPEPVGEPVYQIRLVDGAWMDLAKHVYEEKVNLGHLTVRALYTRFSPGVPEGFALVPVEPTDEIRQAFFSELSGAACSYFDDDSDPSGGFAQAWRNAIAAAQAKGVV